jgi:hypothetical protein
VKQPANPYDAIAFGSTRKKQRTQCAVWRVSCVSGLYPPIIVALCSQLVLNASCLVLVAQRSSA